MVVPRVPWTRLEQHLKRRWQPGQHAALLGPTRSGKTHVALFLGEMCKHTVVVATKRRDDLVTELSKRGYVLVPDMDKIPFAEVHGGGREPVHRRVLVWANPQIKDEKLRQATQQRQLRQALGTMERQGGWCVVLDETMWLYKNLKLEAEMDSLWFQAASSKVSVVACAQRPVSVPRQMLAQASILFLWHIGDKRDYESLREVAGVIPQDVIVANVQSLDWEAHEFLYVEPHTGFIARTVAPPR